MRGFSPDDTALPQSRTTVAIKKAVAFALVKLLFTGSL